MQYQGVVHLDGGREGLVGVVGAADLGEEHPLERVELGRHLLGEVLQVGRLDHLEPLLKLVLA